jgi:hypothetical protein
MELYAEFFRQLSDIADDEMLMRRALSSIKRLAKEARRMHPYEEPKPYMREEPNEQIERPVESGSVSHEEVLGDIKRYMKAR